ncbi:hypothetical protein SCUP234_01708 [Seiridium cupressi]
MDFDSYHDDSRERLDKLYTSLEQLAQAVKPFVNTDPAGCGNLVVTMLKHTLEEQENHLRAIKRTLEEAQKLKDEAFNALSPDRHSKLVHDSLKQMAQSQDTRSTEIYQSLNQLISKTSKVDASDEASITAQLTRIQSIQASTTAKQESRLASIEQSLAKSSSLSASLQTDIHKISESVSRIEKATPPRVFDDAIINRIEKMSLNVKSSARAGQGVTQRAPGIPTLQVPVKQTALAEKRPPFREPRATRIKHKRQLVWQFTRTRKCFSTKLSQLQTNSSENDTYEGIHSIDHKHMNCYSTGRGGRA